MTGISYAEIEEEMRLLAGSESAVIMFSTGISGLDQETVKAIVNFTQLSGKIGKKHSGLIPVAGICNLQGSWDMGLGRNSTELFAGPDPKLRFLFVADHDDGIIRHRERIAGMDFVAYAGAFKNSFMELAHVVFPVAAYTDYNGTYTATDRRVQFSTAKTAATAPAPWTLYRNIANFAGQRWSYAGADEIFSEIATQVPGYAGLSHQKLSEGFGCHWGADRSPEPKQFLPARTAYPAALTTPDYPFALMIGKAQHFWHQHNLMRKTLIPRREFDATLLLYPEGYIEISAEDAKKMQVRDKWLVKVSSTAGSMKIALKISEDVQTGSAYIPYFIKDMISGFLLNHGEAFTAGEEGIIPIKIEKV